MAEEFRDRLRSSFSGNMVVLLFAALTGLFICTLLGLGLVMSIFDTHALDVLSDLNDGSFEHLGALKILQVANSIGLFFVPPLVLAALHKRKFADLFRLSTFPNVRLSGAVVILFIFLLPLVNFVAFLNSQITFPESWQGLYDAFVRAEESANMLTKAFLQMDGPLDLIVNIFLIALIPAIGEELLFRGSLQELIEKRFGNPYVAIWVTAAIFSAIHQQFFGFFPRLFLGALLGYLFYWSRNLWVPILGHFANNAFAVFLSFFFAEEVLDAQAEEFGNSWEEWLGLAVSVVVCGSLIVLLKAARQKAVETDEVQRD